MRSRLTLVLAAFALAIAYPCAAAWEEPSHWSELGDVADWLHRDAQLYRLADDLPFSDRSQQGVDQRGAYRSTRSYEGRLPALGLADFLNLTAAEQAERIDAAGRHRDHLVRFRNRMDTYVNQARSNEAIGWGGEVSDVTVVGDCLRQLRAAVGLDPANPRAWHLYAMFAAVVGDLERAAHALDGAALALARVPDDALPDLRRAVALDRAWLARDRGDLLDARRALAEAVAQGADGLDAILLSGLVAAQTGDENLAMVQAGKLGGLEIRKFPQRIRNNGWSPEITNMGAWRGVASDYAQAWIMALVWIGAGDLEMAGNVLGDYDVRDSMPQTWRFWNDAGHIYAMTGRPRQASRAWQAARIWRPYAPFFPVKLHEADVGGLTGQRGKQTLYVAFDSFLVAGNRLAEGFRLAEMVTHDPDDLAAQAAAGRALDALEVCRGTGIYPAQARVLEGAVYHRMGDRTSAVLAVEEALALLNGGTELAGGRALLLALGGAGSGLADIQAFFGQSGSARARWGEPTDLEQLERDLRAAYDDQPDEATRRDLARFMIRAGDPRRGRELVARQAPEQAEDMILLLEADRALGDPAEALRLVAGLARGVDPYDDARVWTLAGFVCLDEGETAAGRRAIERALELDPGNRALRVQLQLLHGRA